MIDEEPYRHIMSVGHGSSVGCASGQSVCPFRSVPTQSQAAVALLPSSRQKHVIGLSVDDNPNLAPLKTHASPTTSHDDLGVGRGRHTASSPLIRAKPASSGVPESADSGSLLQPTHSQARHRHSVCTRFPALRTGSPRSRQGYSTPEAETTSRWPIDPVGDCPARSLSSTHDSARIALAVDGTGAGLQGAQDMSDASYALGEQVHLRILATVEQDDHVAVRWQVEGLQGGTAAAMMGIYRFEAGRIVEDWGLAVGAPMGMRSCTIRILLLASSYEGPQGTPDRDRGPRARRSCQPSHHGRTG